MAKRLPAQTVKYASALAVLALAAFTIYQIHIAIVIWEWIGRYLGGWIAAGIAAIVLFGLVFLHHRELAEQFKKLPIGRLFRHLRANRPVYLRTTASLLLGLVIGLFLPSLKSPQRLIVANPQSANSQEENVDNQVAAGTNPVPRTVEPANLFRPLPKQVGVLPPPRKDYCEIGPAFNVDACRPLIEQNPTAVGQGGRRLRKDERIILRKIGSEWEVEIIRLPPPRVKRPLNILAP